MPSRPRADEVEADLECVVCLELPVQVYQCRNGHLMCPDCFEKVRGNTGNKKCPSCRVNLAAQPIRNVTAEKQIARLPAQCRHCGSETTRSLLADHEASCPHRPTDCKAKDDGCLWRGAQKDVEAHEAGCVHAIVAHIVQRKLAAVVEQRVQEALAAQQRHWEACFAVLEEKVEQMKSQSDAADRGWKYECTVEGHTRGVMALAAVGTKLFSGSSDYSIRVWDTASHAHLATLEGHTAGVRALATVGTKLFSGSDDKSIRVWCT